MDEKALGKRLQLARRRAGLTQQELCQKAGLSYSTLAKIERGAIRSPSVFTVAAIAHATNSAIEDLLSFQNQDSQTLAQLQGKKRSKSGITFVYMDINGTLVRFFNKAFVDVARRCGEPTDIVETIFWRHHDAVATGSISFEQFDSIMGKELSLPHFKWEEYYLENVETMPGVNDLVRWIAQYYEIGIFSNSFPGVIEKLLAKKTIPDVKYTAVIDSSKVGLVKPDPQIYQKALQLANVEPREILLIDNERPNLKSADTAGWHGLYFDETDPEDSITRTKSALEF